MDKFTKERKILNLAEPILKEIYNEFSIIENQTDNPDAAIKLPNKDIIGIEITSVDPQKVQAYFKDTKFEKDIEKEELGLVLKGKHSNKPRKKLSIPITNSYIFDGIKPKQKKYSQYMESGEYKDIILISFGDYLEVNDNFLSYYKPWTWYLLNKESFPFDKVIYICKRSKKPILIFDKKASPQKPPKQNSDIESGITVINGPILPFGKTINLNNIYKNEPSIRPKQKKKSNKKKQKAQKESRKRNR